MAKNVILSLNFKEKPDGKKNAFLDQLLSIIVKKASQIDLSAYTNSEEAMTLIQSIPNIDDRMHKISLYVRKESQIPILMEFLASPRPDGKQRVICARTEMAQKVLESIKKVEKLGIFPAVRI
jgi:hypothetical protein